MDYRYSVLVLSLINVTQPVSKKQLLEALGTTGQQQLDEVVDLLVQDGLVKSLPGDMLRVTWAGQQALESRDLRKSRDVQRMWYLSDRSDNCR